MADMDVQPNGAESPPPKTIYKPDDHQIRVRFTEDFSEAYAFIWGVWHHYDPERGIWVEAKRRIRRELEAYLASALFRGLKVNNSRIEGVLKMSQNYLPECDELPEFPDLIPLANGVYDIRAQSFSDHQPGYYFREAMTFDYVKDAGCPTWVSMLCQIIVHDDDVPDWDTIDFIQEAIGYALWGDNRLQASFFFWGDGGTGKSTVLETAQKLTNSRATIDLETLSDNEMAMLPGVRMVVFNELDKGATIPEAAFKRLVSSDRIKAKLLYKDYFTFQPICTVFGAMNHLPRIKDRGKGVFRRIHVVPFDKKVSNPDVYLPIKLENELSGIFNWAMEGLKRLLDRGHFEPSPRVQQAKDDWIYQQDTERQFVDAMCVTGAEYQVQASAFYSAYRDWCRENGYIAKSVQVVAQDWERMTFERRKSNGRNFWHGVGLRADIHPMPDVVPPQPNAMIPINQPELLP